MRGERDGGPDGAWRVREVDVAPLAEVPEVEADNDGGRQEAERGEGMCRDGSVWSRKLTDRSRRNEGTYST